MSVTIMSRKAYRFLNPGRSIAPVERYDKDPVTGKVTKSVPDSTQDFKEAHAEVHPGAANGSYGNPVTLPDWVKNDGMFKLAVKDADIVVLTRESGLMGEEKAADAAKQATLANARKANADSSVDLGSMTKAELVAHAAEHHDLDLDIKDKHDDLVAQIKDAQTKAA